MPSEIWQVVPPGANTIAYKPYLGDSANSYTFGTAVKPQYQKYSYLLSWLNLTRFTAFLR